jgi:hypothetical protein
MSHEFEEMIYQAARDAQLCEGCPIIREPLRYTRNFMVEQLADDAATVQEIEEHYLEMDPNIQAILRSRDLGKHPTLRQGRYEQRKLRISIDVGHIAALGSQNAEQPCKGAVRKENLFPDESKPPSAASIEYKELADSIRKALMEGDPGYSPHSDLPIQCEAEIRFYKNFRRSIQGDGTEPE